MTARSNPPEKPLPDLPSALTDPIRERLFNSRSLIISGEINQQQASSSRFVRLPTLLGGFTVGGTVETPPTAPITFDSVTVPATMPAR